MQLRIEPTLTALGPGDVADLLVRVHNDGDERCLPVLDVHGIDPDDFLVPDELVVVPPGAVMTAIVRVRVPEDATPGDRPISIAASDAEGQQPRRTGAAVLRVGRRPDVAIEVDPAASVGRRGARARTVLRNRSDRRLQVDLAGSGEGVAVSFRPARVTLDPGETLQVPTRIRRTARSLMQEVRHGAIVRATGIGAPATTTLTFTQRPAIPRVALHATAALSALALWFLGAFAVYQWITADDPVVEASGAGVAAAPGPGRTSAAALGLDEDDGGVNLPVVIQGAIGGPRDPSGISVTAELISFGDEGTTSGPTKLVALTGVRVPRGAVLDQVQVTTDERGRFRIASGLREEAFYRVTAFLPGFDVASFVVRTSAEEREVELAFALEPGRGALSGTVRSTSGEPIGGAQVVVTDGTAAYTTATASEGDGVGTWSLEGLTTPTTYQVVVTQRGFATETLVLELEGGRSISGVDAVLAPDRGTVRGTITAVNPATNTLEGVGGIDLVLSGPEGRETKSLTSPAGLRGRFDFPNLPYGTYELTFSGEGWRTQVTQVVVDRGDVVLDVTDLVRSTGIVEGFVVQQVLGGADLCRYPRASITDDDTVEEACGGVTVSLTSDEGDVLATASASLGSLAPGFFRIEGVPAGVYVLEFSQPGYRSHVRSVDVRAGRVLEIRDGDDGTVALADDPIRLRRSEPAALCIGLAQITLVDARDGSAIPGDSSDAITVPGVQCAGDPPQIGRIGTGNSYLIQNMPLGVRRVEVRLPGFSTSSALLAVDSVDLAAATVAVSPLPRDVTGTYRAVQRSGARTFPRTGLMAVLLDDLGNPTGRTTTFSTSESVLGSGVFEGRFTFEDVAIADGYSVVIEGRGIEQVSSAPFDLVGGEDPLDITGSTPLSSVARSTVSGRVLGFAEVGGALVIEPLAGATVRVPSAAQPAEVVGFTLGAVVDSYRSVSSVDGFFAVELDAGTYADDGLAAIEVLATGHVTRTFGGATPFDLVAADQTLIGAGTFIPLYATIAAPPPASSSITQVALSTNVATLTTGAAHGIAVGDLVVVDGAGAPFDGTRTVTAVTATTFSFALTAGDVAPRAPAGSAVVARGALGLDPAPRDVVVPVRLLGAAGAERTFTVTLEGGEVQPGTAASPAGPFEETVTRTVAADAENLTVVGVPVGTYTLRISGTDVADLVVPGVVVPPGAAAHTTPDREVQATVTVTLTVQEKDASGVLGQVSGATVTVVGGPAVGASDGDGTTSVVLSSGTTALFEVERTGSARVGLSVPVGAAVIQAVPVELPTRRVTGTVTEVTRLGDGTAGSLPLAGVTVTATSTDVTSRHVVTATDGTYEIHLPHGLTWTLVANETGFATDPAAGLTVALPTALVTTAARDTTTATLTLSAESLFTGSDSVTVSGIGAGFDTADVALASSSDATLTYPLAGTAVASSAVRGTVVLAGDLSAQHFALTRSATLGIRGTVLRDEDFAVTVEVFDGVDRIRTTSVDASGSYGIVGLATTRTYRIVFTATKAGEDPIVVTRWIDAASTGATTVQLDQDVTSASLVAVTVTVVNTAPAPAEDVALTLAEVGPFPSLAQTGERPQQLATAPAEGESAVTFSDVPLRSSVAPQDRSMLADRIRLRVAPPAGFLVDDVRIGGVLLVADGDPALGWVVTDAQLVGGAAITVTLVGAPGAPTIGTVTATSTSELSVEFMAPANDGGRSITGYEYALATPQAWVALPGTMSPQTISGLTPGTFSEVRIRAINDAGTGPASDPFFVTTPVAAPTATATPGVEESITVTWDAPAGVTSSTVEASSGGSVVTQRPLGGGSLFCEESTADSKDLTVPGPTCTLGGLVDGTLSYTFSVRVISGGVASAFSAPTDERSPTVTTTVASGDGCAVVESDLRCTDVGSRNVTFTRIANAGTLEALVVGGGGGGGNDGGGGGGGGGVATGSVSIGGPVTSLTVVVGAGGAGKIHGGGDLSGGPGKSSEILHVVGGAATTLVNATGGARAANDRTGGAGGLSDGGAGGGGGARVGGDGNGEPGLPGRNVESFGTFGGGGGGGATGTNTPGAGGAGGGGAGGKPGESGDPNTGGGGGGGFFGGADDRDKDGGAGGSGIVILRGVVAP